LPGCARQANIDEVRSSAVRLSRRSIAHGPKPALQSRSRPALPRPPHPIPTSVTIAIRPSLRDETARFVGLIWGKEEEVYFCEEDWTGGIALKGFGKFGRPGLVSPAENSIKIAGISHVSELFRIVVCSYRRWGTFRI
jgi:hypothetical protein